MHRWLRTPKAMIFVPLMMALGFIVACGGTTAQPVVVEKEVRKPKRW